MVFGMNMQCPCCRDRLHHCEACWDKFHNGEKHKDFIPPAYYGESMFDEKAFRAYMEGMEKGTGCLLPEPNIKPNKEVKYSEGIYQHPRR